MFIDIHECNNEVDDCSNNATCMNRAGFYLCMCFDGFTGDGVICSGVKISFVAETCRNKKCKKKLTKLFCVYFILRTVY